MGQGCEFVIGGHYLRVAVALGDSALGVDDFFGEETGPVKVEVRRKDLEGEVIDRTGITAWDVTVAELFAHH